MKILVTGTNGFIGSEIVRELLAGNHQIIGVNRKKKSELTVSVQESYEAADITNYQSLAKLKDLENVDVIIHSAGLAHQFGDTKKEEFESVNIIGTENVTKLGIKLKVKQFILISSTAVYGIKSLNEMRENSVYHEDSPTAPQTLYAVSKLEAEVICRRLCELSEIPLTIFRLAPVIGENNVGNVARLIEQIDKNKFVWIGKGKNFKSLIYKNDVAKACLLLLKEKRGQTEIFNLAAEPIKMQEFVVRIATRLNKKIIPVKIPPGFVKTIFKLNSKFLKLRKITKLSETVEKWLADDVYSGEKFLQAYNFQAQTPILEAVDKQVDFYRRQKR